MHLSNAAATQELGRRIAAQLTPGDVVALSGDLGAGKTCLARGILEGLGHRGDVQSPSFALVIPYDGPEMRLPAWHVDLYRIETAAEAEPLALDEALYEGVLIIEWPERLGSRLWPEALQLRLGPDGDGRILTATVPPSWSARWSS